MFDRDVAKGVHRVADGRGNVNWYIVEDGGRLTVVDAGLAASRRSLMHALGELQHSPEEVEALVLTHAHWDHVGFAEWLRSTHGVPVHCHEDEVELTRHPYRYPAERLPLLYLANVRALPVVAGLMSGGGPVVKPIEQVHTFRDGDVLEVPGRPKVIFTPGHTPGHCSLHLADRDVLIVGDAIVMLDPYTGRRGPRIVARAATADSAQALASLDRIAETRATTLLTGHGEVWRQGAQRATEMARAAGVA